MTATSSTTVEQAKPCHEFKSVWLQSAVLLSHLHQTWIGIQQGLDELVSDDWTNELWFALGGLVNYMVDSTHLCHWAVRWEWFASLNECHPSDVAWAEAVMGKYVGMPFREVLIGAEFSIGYTARWVKLSDYSARQLRTGEEDVFWSDELVYPSEVQA
jgi:hypothetical protein